MESREELLTKIEEIDRRIIRLDGKKPDVLKYLISLKGNLVRILALVYPNNRPLPL